MLRVELDHIISEADAAQKILDILQDVEQNGETYAIMSNGHPVAAIVSIDQVGDLSPSEAPQHQQSFLPAEPEQQEMAAAPVPAPAMPEAPAEPELPPMPPLPMETPPAMPEPPAMPSVPSAPPMPSSSGFSPLPSQDLGNSPMAEEPPEDIDGPLIAQAPVTQTPPPNLPPLSGTENLRQGFSVPNIPQP